MQAKKVSTYHSTLLLGEEESITGPQGKSECSLIDSETRILQLPSLPLRAVVFVSLHLVWLDLVFPTQWALGQQQWERAAWASCFFLLPEPSGLLLRTRSSNAAQRLSWQARWFRLISSRLRTGWVHLHGSACFAFLCVKDCWCVGEVLSRLQKQLFIDLQLFSEQNCTHPKGQGPVWLETGLLGGKVGTWSMPGPLNKWPLGREQERESLDVKLNRHVSNPWSSPPIWPSSMVITIAFMAQGPVLSILHVLSHSISNNHEFVPPFTDEDMEA